jgi:short-subunit dehydrogenase
MELNGDTVALITGANGGIGQAIARALAKEGARVVVSGRKRAPLDALAKELGARVVVADLESRDQVRKLLREVGDVDVLVANAAVPASGPVLEFTEAQLDRAIDVNLRVPMLMARVVGEQMVARGRGQLVFVSSISGKVASSNTAIYSATKFGLRGFSLGLRADLRDKGVGVTTVFPGFIRDAGMFADSRAELPAGVGTRTPDDVANAVVDAVRKNPAEIDIAALEQRLFGKLGGLAPGLVGWMEARLDTAKFADQLVEAQRHKR